MFLSRLQQFARLPQKNNIIRSALQARFVFTYTRPRERRSSEARVTSSPGEALSTFIRASRDPKGEEQVWVAKSLR